MIFRQNPSPTLSGTAYIIPHGRSLGTGRGTDGIFHGLYPMRWRIGSTADSTESLTWENVHAPSARGNQVLVIDHAGAPVGDPMGRGHGVVQGILVVASWRFSVKQRGGIPLIYRDA